MQRSNILIVLMACTAMFHNGCIDPAPKGGNRPDDGSCPEGEICSKEVKRLYFSGITLGDQSSPMKSPPFHIATGGAQNIKVWHDSNASMPFDKLPNPDGKYGPFCGDKNNPPAFCALNGGSDVLRVPNPPTPPIVTVVGVHTGMDQLRIMANFGAHEVLTELYDRIVLKVLDPIGMRVVVGQNSDLDFSAVHGDVDDTAIVFAVGSHPPTVVIGIFGEDREKNPKQPEIVRLVDQYLVLTNLPQNLTRDPKQWDTLIVNAPFGQTQDHLMYAMSGSGNSLGKVRLRVVGTVDQLAFARGPVNQVTDGERLVVGKKQTICFSSFSSGAFVYGPKLTFHASNNLELTPLEGEGGPHVKDSCTYVLPRSPGGGRITVTSDANPNIGGEEYRQEFPFNACSTGSCAVAPPAEQRARLRDSAEQLAPGPAPGERALAQ